MEDEKQRSSGLTTSVICMSESRKKRKLSQLRGWVPEKGQPIITRWVGRGGRKKREKDWGVTNWARDRRKGKDLKRPVTLALLEIYFDTLCSVLHVKVGAAHHLGSTVCGLSYSCSYQDSKNRMGAIQLSLALLFLFFSLAQAQWWSFIWANPKFTSGYPPAVSPTITTPLFTTPGPSDTAGTAGWVGDKDRVMEKAVQDSAQAEWSVLSLTPNPGGSVSGQSTEEPRMETPEENTGGGNKSSSQYKSLKYWKSGECVNINLQGFRVFFRFDSWVCIFEFSLTDQQLREKLGFQQVYTKGSIIPMPCVNDTTAGS